MNVHYEERLDELRARIDEIDRALVGLLAERFEVTDSVGRLKAEAGAPPRDPDREAEQRQRLLELARRQGLDEAFALQWLELVLTQVVRNHERIAAGHRES
jgi:chorismate mutase